MLVKQGTAGQVTILAAVGTVGSVAGNVTVCKGTSCGPGGGPYSNTANFLKYSYTAGDTDTLGQLTVSIDDGLGNQIGWAYFTVVAFDPNDPAGLGLSFLDAMISSRGTSNYAGGPVASVAGDVGGNLVGNVGGNLVGNVNGTLAAALSNPAVDSILRRVIARLNGFSLEEVLNVLLAVAAGKSSGFPPGPVGFRDLQDSKTVVQGNLDGNGNRTSVAYNP